MKYTFLFLALLVFAACNSGNTASTQTAVKTAAEEEKELPTHPDYAHIPLVGQRLV